MTKRIVLSTLALCIVCLSAVAGSKPKWQELPVLRCPIRADAPKLNGQLDDAAWKDALKLGPFVTPGNDPAEVPTEALLTCDAQAIYLAVRCAEPDMKSLSQSRTERDSDVWMDDCVEIFIDANSDFLTYHHLVVSVGNVQRDEACDVRKKNLYDVKWNGTWQSAALKGEKEWTVEVAIPYSDLGIAPAPDAMIGLNVCRERHGGGLSVWSPTFGGFHEPSRFGTVLLCRSAESPLRLTATRVEPPAVGILQAAGTLENAGKAMVGVVCSTTTATAKDVQVKDCASFQIPPGGQVEGAMPVVIAEGGTNSVAFVFRDKATGAILDARRMAADIAVVHLEEFGVRLPGGKGYDLWWATSTNKVLKETPLPKEQSPAVTISAAANEYEPFQIVLRSPKPLTRVDVKVSDLTSEKGTIPSSNIRIYQAAYVPVTIRSDSFGMLTDYPDPLPPLQEPMDVPADENAPVWIVVKVPADAKAGDYEGTVKVQPVGAPECDVAVKLHVYDFALTDETHTKTAYGVSPVWKFLGITDPEQKERVFDLYMQSCRDHRIAPYSPMALHPMKEEIKGPSRSFKNGPFEIVCDEYRGNYFDVYWDGVKIGSIHNTMTQFTKEGVGWKKTGVSWPRVDRLREITVVERSDKRWVLDMKAEKVTPNEEAKAYEIVFRFVIPADQHWFSAKMLRLTNTDKEKFEARAYFYILNCADEGAAKEKGKGYACYVTKDVYMGILSPTGAVSPALGATQVAAGARWLNPGESVEVEQPPMIFFAGKGGRDAADLAAKDIVELLGGKSAEEFAPKDDARLTVTENTEPSVTIDFQDFDQAASKYLDGYKFNAFNFRGMPNRLGRFVRFEPEFKRLHKVVYGQMVEHLRQKGWLEKAYAYWYDEPEEKDYPYVNEGMDLLKENCPGLTRLLTEQVEDGLIGHVDLWTPVLSNYDPEKCQLRQAHGDQVWWYVCCGPRAPYPNNFIDHPAINHRIRFWMMEKYGVTGSLYWSTTYWHGKDGALRSPWKDAMSVSPQGGHWGCGDGILLYPPCKEPSETPVLDPPVSTIRWDLLREGLEDREYFWTLREELKRVRSLLDTLSPEKKVAALAVIRQAESALGAPDRLAESLKEYTKNPKDIFRERDRLARAIEACRALR